MPVTQDNPTVFDLIPGVLNWEPPDISQGSPSHMDRVYNLFGVRKALKEGWRHFDEGLLARDHYSQKYNGKTTSRSSGDNSRVNVPLEFGDALINYRLDPTNNLISGLVFNLSPQDQRHMTSQPPDLSARSSLNLPIPVAFLHQPPHTRSLPPIPERKTECHSPPTPHGIGNKPTLRSRRGFEMVQGYPCPLSRTLQYLFVRLALSAPFFNANSDLIRTIKVSSC
jgi:hypothetical protein